MIFKRTQSKKEPQEFRVGIRTQLCRERKGFETRLCEVSGETCIFHRFIDENRVLLNIKTHIRVSEAYECRRMLDEERMIVPGSDTVIVRNTYALVERPDGRLGKVDPEKVRFIDRGVDDAVRIVTRGAAESDQGTTESL